MPVSRIGRMVLLSLLLHVVVMKVPLPQPQDEVDEALELVETVPIKIEREEPILDIVTSSIPTESKAKPNPPEASEPRSLKPVESTQTRPSPSEQIERDRQADDADEGSEPDSEQDNEGDQNLGQNNGNDDGGFEYNDQTGFAILDQSLQLPGSGDCGNQAGCFQVDQGFRDASGDLEALFKSQGYDFDEIQVAEDTEYKAYRLTNPDNPSLEQYLYVLNREIAAGPGKFPKIVAFYVVTQEAHTLAELNQKLNAN